MYPVGVYPALPGVYPAAKPRSRTLNVAQFLQDLIEQLEGVDLGEEGANEELKRDLPRIRSELRATLHYAQMAGVDRNLDVRSFRAFINETQKVVRATGDAKRTLDATFDQIDEWTAGGGDFERLAEELGNLGDIGIDDDEIARMVTELSRRNTEGATDRAESIKERIMDSTGQTTEKLAESYADMIRDLQEEVGAVGVQAANSILDSVISSVRQGENQTLTIGQIRQRATGYGISEEELEGLRGTSETPDDLMDSLRQMVEDRESTRADEIRGMVGGLKGYDLRTVGYSPQEKAQEFTDAALDTSNTEYTATGALREAADKGLISPAEVASLENASDSQIMAAVAPALGQDSFDQARTAGGLRTALGSGVARAGGAGAVATGVLAGGIDLATPGGQSMVEAGAQAAGSFGTAAGAGIGAGLGLVGGPLGALAGGVVGGMVGGMADQAVQPYVSYINQQRQMNQMFGLSEEGVSYDPRGMLPGNMQGPGGSIEEDYGALRRAQTDARLENPALSGNEIDGLVESLASLGLTARGTAESLDIASELVAKSGLSIEAAAYTAAMGSYSEEGSELTGRAVSSQRSRLAGQGLTGAQYDEILTSGEAVRGDVGGVASFDFAQGTAETVGAMGGQNQSDFIASGGARNINELKAAFINNPPLLAQFSGNPELQHTPVYDDNGEIRPEFREAINTGMTNMVREILSTRYYEIGDGRAEVAQGDYPFLQSALTNLGAPFTVQELLILSEELGKNPDLFGESDRRVEEGNREAAEGLRKETGQRRPGQTEKEVTKNRGDMTEDYRGAGFDMGDFLTKDWQGEMREGFGGIANRIRGRNPGVLRDAAEGLEGEQPYLAALSNIQGFDPDSMGIVGSDATLEDVAKAASSKEGSRLRDKYSKEIAQMESGKLRTELEGGARGGKGYSIRELSEGFASQDIKRDGESLRLTDEARNRERDYGPEAGGTANARVSADVKVTASDDLSRLFNFEQSEDPQTASGRLARSEARNRRNRKGGKMAEDARIY